MTENAKYFEEIRKKYPPIISKDQSYQIAHISKATALYLLQSGLVPCKDSGKRTRRYSTHIDDVRYYLINRELQPEKYRAYEHCEGKKKERNFGFTLFLFWCARRAH